MSLEHRGISRATLAVLIATAVFCLYFGASNWFRQVNLVTSQYDLGNMDQTLWQTLHGHWFQMTDTGSPALISRASIHADFLLLIYLPFYAIWPDPRVVLVLQVLFVASGAWPLFWYARKKIGASLAATLAVLYLLYPPQLWGVTFDVHAVVLVAPLLLWAWWAASEKRWWVYGLAIGLALLGKEEVGVVVAAMGLYWGWRRGYRLLGGLSLVSGIGWTALMLGWVIPQARQLPGHFALGYYSDYGATTVEVIRGIFSHPELLLRDLFGSDALYLYVVLITPVAGVAIFGLPILLLAIPELAVNLLSNNPNQHSIYFQYMSVIVPFIFLAVVDGWPRLMRLLPALPLHRPKEWWERRGLLVLTLSGLVATWIWSPLPGTRHHADAILPWRPSLYFQAVRDVAAQLQSDDRVVATNNLVPQFSRRDSIWAFPNSLDQADAIVVLEGGDYNIKPKEEISAAVQQLVQDPQYTVVFHQDDFWYFRPVSSR